MCYGLQEVVISDNGKEFVSDSYKAWGVERRTTTVYHPQKYDKVERFHITFAVYAH